MKYILITLLLITSAPAMAEGPDVVANADADTHFMNLETVYETFVFRNTRWENDIPITVVVMPLHSPEHREFLDTFVGIGHLGYTRRFNNRVNSARDRPPIIVNTSATMLETLSSISGSVGYTKESVRDLLTDYGIEIVEIE